MTTPPWNVTIVLVQWNGKDVLLDCLETLMRLKTKGIVLSLCLVDNASVDGSVSAVTKLYPTVAVLRQKENMGFTGGNNVGMKYALEHGADYIWLLNNDTTVDAHALEELVGVAQIPRTGIVGSKIYFERGNEFHKERYTRDQLGKVLWYAGGSIDWQNMYASHRGVDQVDRGQYDLVEETPFVTGCSMFLTKELVRTIGFLDDRYFLYYEDLDYSLRARDHGYRLYYAPGSKVWHKNAASTDRPGNALHEYYLTRNRLLVGMTYAPMRTKMALLREAVRIVLGKSRVRRRAVFDAWMGRFGGRYLWTTTQ